MTKRRSPIELRLAAFFITVGMGSLTACDALLTAAEPLAAITQAVTSDDAASSDAVDNTANEASADASTHERPPPEGGPGCDGGPDGPPDGHGHGPPPEMVDVAACAPPVADGVDVGRAGRPRGFLAPIYDDDESGDLSDAELAALRADLEAGCTAHNAELLAKFDANADGTLAQDEWDAARAAHREERDADRAALDTDGDGAISRAEHEAAEAALIAAWDDNGDGDLDADERAVMRADLKLLVQHGERLPPLPMHGAHHGHAPPDGAPPDGPPPEGPPPDDTQDDA